MQDLHLFENKTVDEKRLTFRSWFNPKKFFQSSTTTKNSKINQDNNEFIREALHIHNELRCKHNVEPLRLNNDLSKLAQEWGILSIY